LKREKKKKERTSHEEEKGKRVKRNPGVGWGDIKGTSSNVQEMKGKTTSEGNQKNQQSGKKERPLGAEMKGVTLNFSGRKKGNGKKGKKVTKEKGGVQKRSNWSEKDVQFRKKRGES